MSNVDSSPDSDSGEIPGEIEKPHQDAQQDVGTRQPLDRASKANDDSVEEIQTALQTHATLTQDPSQHCDAEAAQLLSTDGEDVRRDMPDWSTVPEVVLTNILRMLPVIDRLNASRACTKWEAAAAPSSCWHVFDYGTYPEDGPVSEESMRKLQSAQQDYLCVIEMYGDTIVTVLVIVCHEESLEVLEKLTSSCRNLRYCTVKVLNKTRLDPPKLVDLLQHLLSNNDGLQEIHLKNVDFEEHYPAITEGCFHTKGLQKLSFINSFVDANVSQLTYLVNLSELTVHPHQLRCIWLYHLAKSSLHTLNIVGDLDMMDFDDFSYPTEHHWRRISQSAHFQVNSYLVGVNSQMLCPEIPLACLACYDLFNIDISRFLRIAKPYSETLTTLINFNLCELSQRAKLLHQPSRSDDNALSFVRGCPKLVTLALNTRLYSSTVLLMIQLNPSFREPIISEDLIDYELHIPDSLEGSEEVRSFTEQHFSEERFAAAVSSLLKRKWCPVPKTEYRGVLERRYFDW